VELEESLTFHSVDLVPIDLHALVDDRRVKAELAPLEPLNPAREPIPVLENDDVLGLGQKG
jgi:hypothetical protein